MKPFKPLLLSFLALSVTAVSQSQASRLVGKWSANLEFDMTKFPRATTPQSVDALERALAEARKTKMSLTLQQAGAFSARLVPSTAGQQPVVLTGTWKLKGRTLTIVVLKANGGKPKPEEAGPQEMLVGEKLNWIRFTPPQGMGSYFHMIRVR
ncbi:MAG TPA: hypothetical protein VK934_09125 [Fimbriimonas sp.]|nr:hypothetical protein [Fimbriimonas sp.]